MKYFWLQTRGPRVVISNPRLDRPTFRPTISNVYGFELYVTDANGIVARDYVEVIVDTPSNFVPVAHAGDDRIHVKVGAVAQLDGTRSYDPVDDPDGVTNHTNGLLFFWVPTGGPMVVLQNPNSARPSFIPPIDGTYEFTLFVDDGFDVSRASTVRFTTGEPPPAPAGGGGGGRCVANVHTHSPATSAGTLAACILVLMGLALAARRL